MDLIDDPVPGSNTPEFSVSEIAGKVRKLIEGELGWVRIKGEVGRVVLARSGHLYFDLKDDRNVLSCMTWKGQVQGLGTMPEEGMEVVAEGRMTASGFQSKFSLNAERIAIAGQGALMALLEKRKKALAAEGLFDDARKRPLPYLPEVIGVVTSLQGAVIRDILHRLRDRFPRKVLIWPVAVQGANCAPEVVRAIEGFNALTPGGAMPRPDLLIVARGGGSVEDLWGFNEEVVARAAAASDIPLISAVGHETDTTLIDFVSDRRAPTPTAAAEMAVPVRHELLAWVEQAGARMTGAVSSAMQRREQRLRDLARALPRADALVEGPRQRLDVIGGQLGPALIAGVQRRKVRLSDVSGSLRPATLQRSIDAEKRRLQALSARLEPALARVAAAKRERFETRATRLTPARIAQDAARKSDRLYDVTTRLHAAGQRQVDSLQRKLDAMDRLRETLSYKATLARGYAVVRGDGGVLTTKAAAEQASGLEIEFADGRLKLGGGKTATKKAAKTPEQGSLF
ncbi:exodeoxyribonuclease VII large subunit [Tateyamaria omphalii]|uniref:exodeoxyribonuclease VII large subunit n=1 Tax=Tateyamaria omphalii TaxID=299262 RepID=UPI001C990956|nr:exodeoxyribonuclease VII large subunit [Tateyamaria omphalii]MBY5933063.1 exodeoxyribonuclease VII large subunit [Tateyamaria omphalii]